MGSNPSWCCYLSCSGAATITRCRKWLVGIKEMQMQFWESSPIRKKHEARIYKTWERIIEIILTIHFLMKYLLSINLTGPKNFPHTVLSPFLHPSSYLPKRYQNLATWPCYELYFACWTWFIFITSLDISKFVTILLIFPLATLNIP